jgi:hypothetical protein
MVISNVPFEVTQGSDTGKEMEIRQQSCPDLNFQRYKGILFHEEQEGLFYKYQVYLPKLKLISTITLTHEQPLYCYYTFSAYLFEEEYNAKRKIRLQLEN